MAFMLLGRTLITYEPSMTGEYLLVTRHDPVVRPSACLSEPAADRTEVIWRLPFTAASGFGKRLLAADFSWKSLGR